MGAMSTQPATDRQDLVEELHGHRIADPYRWLEDPDSEATRAWVEAQNAWTAEHLAGLPERAWFTETLDQVLGQPRAGLPFHRFGRWLVTRNDGSQDQDQWFVADSLDALQAGGRLVIDPNTLEGAASISSVTVSRDGRLLAYGRSEGGSDWVHFVVIDLDTLEPLADEADVVGKFHAAVWLPDHESFLYQGYPQDDRADGTDTTSLGAAQLRRHRLGTPASQDEVILELTDEPEVTFGSRISHDERWIVVSLHRGTEDRNRVWLLPLSPRQGSGDVGERSSGEVGLPVTLIDEPIARFDHVRMLDDEMILSTDLDAPRGRVIAMRIGDGQVREVVAESEDAVEFVIAAGDELIVGRLHDAAPRIERYGLDGAALGVVDVSGGGVVDVDAEVSRKDWGIAMSTLTTPRQCHRVSGGIATPIDLAAASTYTAPDFTVERHQATSADGTAVPYWLVRPAEMTAEAAPPTILYGYGGFNIAIGLTHRPIWSAWLAAGGVLAIANLRGGGEFGTDWYDDGRLTNKQHVFDDVIAVADTLVDSGATARDRLVLHGGSNGGLLVGAAITQRPDLAAVALPAVGVLDLLRFHKFTIGWAWKSDYGDPDVADDFETALAYSPLHNIVAGTSYPATLVLTGDHDDRVVPLHSHKFTATLQAAQAATAPILTRIETDAGHGMGKPRSKIVAESADMLAFAAHHTGLFTGTD